MAKRKAPKTAFKKGQSGNPNGRPKLSEDMIKVRGAVGKAIAQLGDMITMTVSELKEIINNPESTAIQVLFANAIIKKDWRIVESVINRTYGKPKETLDLNGKIDISNTTEELQKLTTKQLKDIRGILKGHESK